MSNRSENSHIRLSKRPGTALLGIVLVGLIVLAIVSAVAINIGWNASHMEAWQTKNIERRRLDALARSAANMVAETISKDTTLDQFGTAGNVEDGVSSDITKIVTEPANTYLKITLRGANRNDYKVTSIASTDNELVTVTLTRSDNGDGTYSTTWGRGQ